MADTLGELEVRIEAKFAQFEKDIDAIQRKVDREFGQIEDKAKRVDRTLADFGKGFADAAKKLATAGGVVAGALTAVGAAAFGSANQLADTAAKLGLSTEALQAYRFAAEQTGVSQQAVDLALQRFTRRLAEAQQGQGELVKTIQQYNIELQNSDGTLRSSTAVFRDYADLIARTTDSGEQLRLAFKAFDSEGAALVNTLRGGAEGLDEFEQRARSLGLVMDQELVQRAAEVNSRIGSIQTALTNAFQAGLLDASIDDVEALSRNIDDLSKTAEDLGRVAGDALGLLASGARLAADNIEIVGVAAGIALAAFAPWTAAIGAVTVAIGLLRSEMADAGEEFVGSQKAAEDLAAAQSRLDEIQRKLAEKTSGAADATQGLTRESTLATEALELEAKAAEAAVRQLAAIAQIRGLEGQERDLSERERMFQSELVDLSQTFGASSTQAQAVATQLDVVRDSLTSVREATAEYSAVAAEAAATQEEFAAKALELRNALGDGGGGGASSGSSGGGGGGASSGSSGGGGVAKAAEAASTSIQMLGDGFGEAGPALDGFTQAADDFVSAELGAAFQDVTRSLEDLLFDALTKGEADFEAFGDNILDSLARLATRIASQQITVSIQGLFTGGGGSRGGGQQYGGFNDLFGGFLNSGGAAGFQGGGGFSGVPGYESIGQLGSGLLDGSLFNSGLGDTVLGGARSLGLGQALGLYSGAPVSVAGAGLSFGGGLGGGFSPALGAGSSLSFGGGLAPYNVNLGTVGLGGTGQLTGFGSSVGTGLNAGASVGGIIAGLVGSYLAGVIDDDLKPTGAQIGGFVGGTAGSVAGAAAGAQFGAALGPYGAIAGALIGTLAGTLGGGQIGPNPPSEAAGFGGLITGDAARAAGLIDRDGESTDVTRGLAQEIFADATSVLAQLAAVTGVDSPFTGVRGDASLRSGSFLRLGREGQDVTANEGELVRLASVGQITRGEGLEASVVAFRKFVEEAQGIDPDVFAVLSDAAGRQDLDAEGINSLLNAVDVFNDVRDAAAAIDAEPVASLKQAFDALNEPLNAYRETLQEAGLPLAELDQLQAQTNENLRDGFIAGLEQANRQLKGEGFKDQILGVVDSFQDAFASAAFVNEEFGAEAGARATELITENLELTLENALDQLDLSQLEALREFIATADDGGAQFDVAISQIDDAITNFSDTTEAASGAVEDLTETLGIAGQEAEALRGQFDRIFGEQSVSDQALAAGLTEDLTALLEGLPAGLEVGSAAAAAFGEQILDLAPDTDQARAALAILDGTLVEVEGATAGAAGATQEMVEAMVAAEREAAGLRVSFERVFGEALIADQTFAAGLDTALSKLLIDMPAGLEAGSAAAAAFGEQILDLAPDTDQARAALAILDGTLVEVEAAAEVASEAVAEFAGTTYREFAALQVQYQRLFGEASVALRAEAAGLSDDLVELFSGIPEGLTIGTDAFDLYLKQIVAAAGSTGQLSEALGLLDSIAQDAAEDVVDATNPLLTGRGGGVPNIDLRGGEGEADIGGLRGLRGLSPDLSPDLSASAQDLAALRVQFEGLLGVVDTATRIDAAGLTGALSDILTGLPEGLERSSEAFNDVAAAILATEAPADQLAAALDILGAASSEAAVEAAEGAEVAAEGAEVAAAAAQAAAARLAALSDFEEQVIARVDGAEAARVFRLTSEGLATLVDDLADIESAQSLAMAKEALEDFQFVLQSGGFSAQQIALAGSEALAAFDAVSSRLASANQQAAQEFDGLSETFLRSFSEVFADLDLFVADLTDTVAQRTADALRETQRAYDDALADVASRFEEASRAATVATSILMDLDLADANPRQSAEAIIAEFRAAAERARSGELEDIQGLSSLTPQFLDAIETIFPRGTGQFSDAVEEARAAAEAAALAADERRLEAQLEQDQLLAEQAAVQQAILDAQEQQVAEIQSLGEIMRQLLADFREQSERNLEEANARLDRLADLIAEGNDVQATEIADGIRQIVEAGR